MSQEDQSAQLANIRKAQKGLEQLREQYPAVTGVNEGGDLTKPLLERKSGQMDGNEGDQTNVPEEDYESPPGKPPGKPTGLSSFLSCLKVTVLVTLIIYLWTYSAAHRMNELQVLQTLASKDKLIPQLPGNKTVSKSVSKAAEIYAQKHTKYDKLLKGEIPEKSGDVWKATAELLYSEIGDKTFLIVFLFVLGWSNPVPSQWNADNRPGYAVFADGRKIIHHRLTDVSPIRIFILTMIGTLWTSWSMAGKTTPGRFNYWVFQSALILVFFLLNYAFKLMSAHFAVVTRLEAEYEQSSGKQSQSRERRTQEWAQDEIKYSKLFNEAHKESVFTAFSAQNENNMKDLTRLDSSNKGVNLFNELTDEKLSKLGLDKNGQVNQELLDKADAEDKSNQQKQTAEQNLHNKAFGNSEADDEDAMISGHYYLKQLKPFQIETLKNVNGDKKKLRQILKGFKIDVNKDSVLDDMINNLKLEKKLNEVSKYAQERKLNIDKNKEQWDKFMNSIQDNYQGIQFDEKKRAQTLILDDRDGHSQAKTVVWPDPKKWSNIEETKYQYNMLNGDTLGDLYKKLSEINKINQSNTGNVNQSKKSIATEGDEVEKENKEEDLKEEEQLFEDLNSLVSTFFGKDTKLTFLVCFILSLIQVMFTDLFFIAFFASQELMDSSNIHMMNMKPFYKTSTLSGALFMSKLSMNLILILTVHIFSSKFVTVYEGHCVGVMAIYFICAYEFILNVLITLAKILELDTINTTMK